MIKKKPFKMSNSDNDIEKLTLPDIYGERRDNRKRHTAEKIAEDV